MAKKTSIEEQEVVITETLSKTEAFLEKNGRKLSILFITLLVIAGAVYGYRALVLTPRAEKAAELIDDAQSHFDAENIDYEVALLGDDEGAGFLDVIEQYGSTPSGNLAQHYAGICYLNMGDFENAKKYLAAYSSVSGLAGAIINAQNLGLQGDVAVELNDYSAAVKFYNSAVQAAENNLTAPMYLRKAALAEQALGNEQAAAELFKQILSTYPTSMEAREAEKLLGTTNIQ